MRIALGGITHEANTFCPHRTDLADFEARQLLRGDEILANWQATRTEQAGALSVLTNVPELRGRPDVSGPGAFRRADAAGDVPHLVGRTARAHRGGRARWMACCWSCTAQ